MSSNQPSFLFLRQIRSFWFLDRNALKWTKTQAPTDSPMAIVAECRTGVLDLAVASGLEALDEWALQEPYLVLRAVEPRRRQLAVVAWVGWQVTERRRCALLLPRLEDAEAWRQLLQELLPHLRVLVWTPDIDWPQPVAYDVVICSYRKFCNHLARSVSCGFHAVAAIDLHWVLASREGYLAEVLLQRICERAKLLRLLCLVPVAAERFAAWLEAFYLPLDDGVAVDVEYAPVEDEDEAVAVVARQGSESAVFVPAGDRAELESLFRRYRVDVAIHSFEADGNQRRVRCAVVRDADATRARLEAIGSQLCEGGRVVVLCQSPVRPELRQLVGDVLGAGEVWEADLDLATYLLQTLRRCCPLGEAFRLAQHTLYAQQETVERFSFAVLQAAFDELRQEGLVRRHGKPTGQLGGTAGCTPLGRRLAASIYDVARYRAARGGLGPGKVVPDAVFRAAAQLAAQPDLETFLRSAWHAHVAQEAPSGRVVRSALFAVSLIDKETAQQLEKKVQALGWQSSPSTAPARKPPRRKRRVRLEEVVAYVYRALIGGQLEPGGKRVGGRRALHYREVAADLKVSPFGVYRAFRDYFDTEIPAEERRPVREPTTDKVREQLRSIRQYTRLIHYQAGWHRPRLLLVRGSLEQGELVLPLQFTETCGDCTYLNREAGLCALWYWVARERPDLADRDARISARLHGCRHFTPKTDFTVNKPATTTLIAGAALSPDIRWICARSGCGGLLDRPPKVGVIARCQLCGTEYRKLPRGPLRAHVGFLDVLRNDVRSILGYVPEELARDLPLPRLSLFLGPDDRIIRVTDEALTVSYARGRCEEAYGLATVEHVSLEPESAESSVVKFLRSHGCRLTVRRRPALQSRPSPAMTQALRRGQFAPSLFLRHCIAQYLSVLHVTAALPLSGEVDHEQASRVLWRQLDRLQLHSERLAHHPNSRTRLRICEAQMMRELTALLRRRVAQENLPDVGAVGRRRGRRVTHWSRFPLGVARGWTPLDAALNLASRLLRHQLRVISAELGFGWNTHPLFLHEPRDHPGLGVHLDLEEVPRLQLHVLVALAFCNGQLTAADFNTDYTSSRLPFYTPTLEGHRKLRDIVERLLHQPVQYGGEVVALATAHRRHVRHLVEVLTQTRYDQYQPLVWAPVSLDALWNRYVPLEQFRRHVDTRLHEPLRTAFHEVIDPLWRTH